MSETIDNPPQQEFSMESKIEGMYKLYKDNPAILFELRLQRIESYLSRQVADQLASLNPNLDDGEQSETINSTNAIEEWRTTEMVLSGVDELIKQDKTKSSSDANKKPYRDVAQYNAMIGNKPVSPGDDNFQSVVARQSKIIKQEVFETIDDGFKADNFNEIRDGACDILVTVYGMLYLLDYDYENMIGESIEEFNVSEEMDKLFTYPVICEAVTSDEHINKIFGNSDKTVKDFFIDSLTEDYNRLLAAVEKFDESWIVETCVSLVFKAMLIQAVHELDSNADMEIVNESNFSKFCKTEEEAQATIDKFAKINVPATYHPVEVAPELFVVKASKTVVGDDGKEYPEGKQLKSVNYKPVKFS